MLTSKQIEEMDDLVAELRHVESKIKEKLDKLASDVGTLNECLIRVREFQARVRKSMKEAPLEWHITLFMPMAIPYVEYADALDSLPKEKDD